MGYNTLLILFSTKSTYLLTNLLSTTNCGEIHPRFLCPRAVVPVGATFLDRHALLKALGHLVVRVPVEVALEHLACLEIKDTFAISTETIDDARFGKQNVAHRKLAFGASARLIARP